MRQRRRPPPFSFLLHDLDAGEGAASPSLTGPPVDIVDDGKAWRLVFEIPGSIPSRLDLEITGRIVVLRGERRATEGEPGQFIRVERVPGPFERALELPDDPDPDRTKASFSDGLLTVTIPRLNRESSRTIPIRRTDTSKR
ncbi:MAG: Hsp20/alpha crystallin family protein [Acidobacteria bacterium]|nr:Hsp20/alpha crystallin family protein [Acidobacteriota bacterium]MCG3192904.1 hypothetical protein [Thermoanaerobaculia bacterium]MCK6683065.1 Hsp20/alpha crystallin family protein [Thermoanaerobaculia bacterium]